VVGVEGMAVRCSALCVLYILVVWQYVACVCCTHWLYAVARLIMCVVHISWSTTERVGWAGHGAAKGTPDTELWSSGGDGGGAWFYFACCCWLWRCSYICAAVLCG